jgi:DNA-binding NarL/FixJ family response regulator
MNRKVFIIFSSEIISKGLATIIRNYFNIEVTQLKSIINLSAYQDISNCIVIIFIDSDKSFGQGFIYKLQKNRNRVLVIGMFPDQNISVSNFSFDFRISTQTSSSKIQEILSDILKSPKSRIYEHEGEELTTREKDVLQLVALGYSNKEIAGKLFISIHTVISHRKKITEKLGIKSISGLTVYAILNKLIDTENIDPESLI